MDRLVIIGNGFDLGHRLKTRFSDFIGSNKEYPRKYKRFKGQDEEPNWNNVEENFKNLLIETMEDRNPFFLSEELENKIDEYVLDDTEDINYFTPNKSDYFNGEFNKILNDYVASHLISSVIIDTYNREIERYRDRYMVDTEWYFFYDSKLILDYINTYPEKENEKWLITIKYIDLLLNKCGLSLKDKMDLCNQIYEVMSIECGTNNKATNEQLKLKYRNHSKIIEELINDDGETHEWIKELNIFFNKTDFFLQKIKNDNQSERMDILKSIIHMHINRLFRTKQRINECVIYYLLFKFYNSTFCILKNNIHI